MDFLKDERFAGIRPFDKRVFLATPTIHDNDEMQYIRDAFEKNWVTTAGENIEKIEELAADYVGVPYVVALSCGTSALHLAVKLAAERLYHSRTGISTPDGLGAGGALLGRRVFCSDITFDATVNPIMYEGGEPVFIDSEYETWNMDPAALEKAFSMYPDVRLVILAHLYGTPGKIDRIKAICKRNNALLIEDAAESLGARYKGEQTGGIGDYGIFSFNGNKLVTGSSGGMLMVHDEYSANKARKWSTQSREAADWYEHEELGYNYRISNVIAGIIRGQWPHIREHIEQKTKVYERYKEGLKDLPVTMNPIGADSVPNHWLSCMLIDKGAMAESSRSERGYTYRMESGKSCPSEILAALRAFHAEGRPIWKPMHMQPIFRNHAFITAGGNGRGNSDAYRDVVTGSDAGADIFERGLCLPSDNKMTEEQQAKVIDIIHRCFQ